MLQLRYSWRALDPAQSLNVATSGITLRGWNKGQPVSLPSEYLSALKDKRIPRRASVGDIMFRVCPTWRDMYLSMMRVDGIKTWGGLAGQLSEEYFRQLIEDHFSASRKSPGYDYASLQKASKAAIKKFSAKNESRFKKLSAFPTPGNQTDWLQHCLNYAGTHEIAAQELDIDMVGATATHSKPKETKISPDPALGLSAEVAPDFIFPDLHTVGDMKTGRELKDHHLLTCTGYALAYESANPEAKIDYGMVYFFPTQQKTLSFAQSHIFAIDDELRRRFLDMRNDLYGLMLKQSVAGKEPAFPDKKEVCPSCKYLDYCKKKGLEI